MIRLTLFRIIHSHKEMRKYNLEQRRWYVEGDLDKEQRRWYVEGELDKWYVEGELDKEYLLYLVFLYRT